MFNKWKVARADREAKKLKFANDAYLRRIKNSAECLTGTEHSGLGGREALSIYEIRSILRREVDRLADKVED